MSAPPLPGLPATPPAGDAAPPHERHVVTLAVVIVLLLSLGIAALLWRSRDDTLHTWERYLGTLSATAAEHATQTVTSAHGVLDRVVDHLHDDGMDSVERLRIVAPQRTTAAYLGERVRDAPVVDVIALVDVDGNVVASSRGLPAPSFSVRDRDYYQVHRADPEVEQYLSAPAMSRGSGQWTFFLARKLRAPGGAMIGLAVVGIQVRYFEHFYASLEFSQPGSTVELWRRDGTLIARHPGRPESLGRPVGPVEPLRALEEALRHGQHSATLTTRRPREADREEAPPRLLAAHLADTAPLVVVTGADHALMLAQWQRTAVIAGALTALADATILALAAWIRCLLRRRRTALARLEEARAAAEAANLVKSRFLADISHEIRTPLHGMLGMTGLLLDGPLGPAQREQAQLVERSGRRLLLLIDDVLDFSRIEAGRLQLEHIAFDLLQVAEDAVALHGPRAAAKGLALTLSAEDAAERPQVTGDPLRLTQILDNLLSNAVKFTPAGAVTVTLSREGLSHWRLAVRDTGIGMNAEQHARLFVPFAQADRSIPRRFGGSGLGLSIVHRLVQLHAGTLDVSSVPGEGTEFACVLRLPPAAVATRLGLEPAADTPPAPSRRLCVLVAEDEPVNMMVTSALLDKLGMTVVQATDGRAAVALNDRARPDVVLMDMHMPHLDGVEATRAIRARERAQGRPRTPIAALTANVLPEDRVRCMDAGMDDLLVKPFDAPQLAALLARLAASATAAPTPPPPVALAREADADADA